MLKIKIGISILGILIYPIRGGLRLVVKSLFYTVIML
jgi:hypothetical protein